MNVTIYYTHLFEIKFKRYRKKFLSLNDDLKHFIELLPQISGIDLGGGIHKYRLSVKSKNRGKSGGFRIISFEILLAQDHKSITFVTLYDKNEQPDISRKEINSILKEEGLI